MQRLRVSEMERQKSFTVKSTSFWALSILVSSSLFFFIVVSFWALRSSPPQPSTLRFTAPIAPASPKAPILIHTHLTESENTSGSSVPATLRDLVTVSHSNLASPATEIEQLIDPPTPSQVPVLINTRIAESGNSSGSWGSSDVMLAVRKYHVIGHSEPDRIIPELDKSLHGLDLQSRVEIDDENRMAGFDLGKGRWVYDESYPLYTNSSCPFIDEGFNCGANGRPDVGYMKWRWQPRGCRFPRFNATGMLELIRGKRLVFVGDSINRNQWESMMCLLFGAVKDPKKVHETRRRRITKEKGNYCFRFVDYQCTVEYYVTHFLVREGKSRVGQRRVPTLRIDAIDRGSSRWKGADILVFNTAHWWSHYKTKAGVNYYQEGTIVHHKLDVSMAFHRALATWASWVDKYIDPRKTQVFFRSPSPSHFSGGEWNSGGHCREATVPLEKIPSMGFSSEKSMIVEEIIKGMKTPITLLNITGLSSYRIDAHPSTFGGRPQRGRSSGIEDCSHWCLPGVPDTWNELLYIHLHRKQHNYRQKAA